MQRVDRYACPELSTNKRYGALKGSEKSNKMVFLQQFSRNICVHVPCRTSSSKQRLAFASSSVNTALSRKKNVALLWEVLLIFNYF